MTIQNFKIPGWVDFFLYTLVEPRELYRQIHSNIGKAFPISFIVPAMVCITNILALSLMGVETSYFYYKISFGWVLFFLYEFLKIVMYSSMIDSFLQLQGFRGNFKEVITLVNFSMVPKVFLLPLMYFFTILNFVPLFFFVMVSFFLFSWYLFTLLLGLSEMNSVSPMKSFGIYILPAFFLGVTLFLIFFFLLMMGAGVIFG